ncbi:hypothetical protein HII27_22605 [Kluyvera sp. SCKS090646]|uniref:Phage protein n=1 Tax=Kluyvera sichuanensis TaxID=2725494 RepID=A0ABR6RZE4_9ENTR|nr:hypothetical protein [Kluyvera sichuanensis]MBC1188484.1 hypothetical protein [Kluyvera sichuanensis]
MKINLFEMEGLLRGQCIPGDLLVNETLAEYLVRQFDKLEQQLAAVVAENAGMTKFIKDDCWIWDDKSEEYFDAGDCIPETPATDAYLTEVRAQGVEMLYASRAAQWTDELLAELDEFATQLREGGIA